MTGTRRSNPVLNTIAFKYARDPKKRDYKLKSLKPWLAAFSKWPF